MLLVAAPPAPVLSQDGAPPLHAVVNDSLTLPPGGSVVIADLLSSKSWLAVQDGKTGNRLKIPLSIQSSEGGAAGSHGSTYVYRGIVAFPDTGDYLVSLNIEGVGEDHRPFPFERRWRVRVGFPTLIAPLSVDTAYYFGETGFINFATREFKEASLYGFDIRAQGDDTAVVVRGNGSFVSFDSLITEHNASEEKSFVIRGLYAGKSFRFFNPLTNAVEASVWTIRIRKPRLTIVTSWDDPKEFRSGGMLFDMHQRVDWGPMQFRCVLLARRGNAWLHLPPRPPRAVTITARPPEFLPALSRARFKVNESAAPWYIIDLNPSPEFLKQIGQGEYRDVTITIQFETQFGERTARTFMASVY